MQDVGFKALSELTQLEMLKLHHAYELKEFGWLSNLTQLLKLSLQGCPQVDNDVMGKMSGLLSFSTVCIELQGSLHTLLILQYFSSLYSL